MQIKDNSRILIFVDDCNIMGMWVLVKSLYKKSYLIADKTTSWNRKIWSLQFQIGIFADGKHCLVMKRDKQDSQQLSSFNDILSKVSFV